MSQCSSAFWYRTPLWLWHPSSDFPSHHLYLSHAESQLIRSQRNHVGSCWKIQLGQNEHPEKKTAWKPVMVSKARIIQSEQPHCHTNASVKNKITAHKNKTTTPTTHKYKVHTKNKQKMTAHKTEILSSQSSLPHSEIHLTVKLS